MLSKTAHSVPKQLSEVQALTVNSSVLQIKAAILTMWILYVFHTKVKGLEIHSLLNRSFHLDWIRLLGSYETWHFIIQEMYGRYFLCGKSPMTWQKKGNMQHMTNPAILSLPCPREWYRCAVVEGLVWVGVAVPSRRSRVSLEPDVWSAGDGTA